MGLGETLFKVFLFLISDFYPCYYSLKGYKSPNSIADVEYWHKYWIIRSFLLMIEYLLWEALIKIPGILYVRICIYMALACFGCAGLLYDRLLDPFLKKNEQKIDEWIDYLKAKLTYYLGTAINFLTSFIMNQAWNFILRTPSQPRAEEAKQGEVKKEEVKEEPSLSGEKKE